VAPPSEARVSCGALSAERLALIEGKGAKSIFNTGGADPLYRHRRAVTHLELHRPKVSLPLMELI